MDNTKTHKEFSEDDVIWIKNRIDSEFNKHGKAEGLDWSLIAAKKIVSTLKSNYILSLIEK